MRSLIFLFVFGLFSVSSRAQIKDVEIIAGPNFGMIRTNLVTPVNETKPAFTSKVGYTLGVGSSFFFKEKLSLGARVLYQKSIVRGDFPFEWSNAIGNLEVTTSFDYISLPIVMKYTLGEKIKFSGELGGFVNCLLNATARDYFLYDSQTPNYSNLNSMSANLAEGTEQYTRLDAGLTVGVSSQIPLSEKLSIKLSVYDNYGLVNISALQFNYRPISSSNYLKSNAINLLAGIVYRMGS